jgi:hypothetical protein
MMIKSLMIASLLLPVANWNVDQFTEQEAAVRKEFFKAGTLPYMRYENGQPVGYDATGIQIPCCGEADAYETDDLRIDEDGNIIAILTCNDLRNCVAIPGKVERAPGTEIMIPELKILIPGKPINNTGHGWVFLGIADGHVICYSRPGGT